MKTWEGIYEGEGHSISRKEATGALFKSLEEKVPLKIFISQVFSREKVNIFSSGLKV